MKGKDSAKRIHNLEHGLGDVTRTPQSSGNAPYVADPTWGVNFRPPRRRSPFPWVVGLVVLGFLVPTIVLLMTKFNASNPRSVLSNIPGTAAPGGGVTAVPVTDTSTAPSGGTTAVPQGGELKVSGNSQTQTIACNDGKLTLSSYSMAFDVTGHCASLAISSYDNHVAVDSVDSINVSGYDNVVTYHSGKPKIADSGRSNDIHQG